jgi:hypothetical protein
MLISFDKKGKFRKRALVVYIGKDQWALVSHFDSICEDNYKMIYPCEPNSNTRAQEAYKYFIENFPECIID